MDTSSIFHGVESQYIDSSGKMRALNYENLTLMISPLPPIDVVQNNKIRETTLKNALKFIESRRLKIDTQDGDSESNKIQGLWLHPDEDNNIHYGYIPIEISDALPDIKYTSVLKQDPLRTERESELVSFKVSRKIADYLKQYSLFEYSHNPKKFGTSTYTIDKNHRYDIMSLNKKLFKNENDVMYEGDKLIVTSKEIRDKLIRYVSTRVALDYLEVMEYKNLLYVKDYYRTIDDFEKKEDTFFLKILLKNTLIKNIIKIQI